MKLQTSSRRTFLKASGISLAKLVSPVLQAAVILAVLNYLLADWVVPDSEKLARSTRNLAHEESTVLQAKQGLWIKDESRVLYITQLLPNGVARDIEIFQLDNDGRLISTIKAQRAIPFEQGWELHQVQQSLIGGQKLETVSYDRLIYEGNLSHQLLEALLIEPRQMSSIDLYAYLNFLEENNLESRAEQLVFWKKLFAPLTIVIMCLLAFPFVLGTQRQGNTGQRLLIGILLGLTFVVVDRLLTQFGMQLKLNGLIVALLPNLVFLGIAFYLLAKKQSHGFTGASFFGRDQA